jgi:hypothetical protein
LFPGSSTNKFRNKQMRQSVNVFLPQTTTRFHRTSLEILFATKNKGPYLSQGSVPPFQHSLHCNFVGYIRRSITFKPQTNIYKCSVMYLHVLIGYDISAAQSSEK